MGEDMLSQYWCGNPISVLAIRTAFGAQVMPAIAGADLRFLRAVRRRDTAQANEGIIEALLEGASIDAVESNGRAALRLAAERGHTESVNILIAAGAELD